MEETKNSTTARGDRPGTPIAKPRSAPWAIRHNEALSAPRSGHEKAWALWIRALSSPTETPVRDIMDGIRIYESAHRARYESELCDDYVLGPMADDLRNSKNVAESATALHGLLNGELGRLDGGTLSGWLIELGGE